MFSSLVIIDFSLIITFLFMFYLFIYIYIYIYILFFYCLRTCCAIIIVSGLLCFPLLLYVLFTLCILVTYRCWINFDMKLFFKLFCNYIKVSRIFLCFYFQPFLICTWLFILLTSFMITKIIVQNVTLLSFMSSFNWHLNLIFVIST